MKTYFRFEASLCLLVLVVSQFTACSEKKTTDTNNVAMATDKVEAPKATSKKPLSQDFKDYWYAGEAEITSYRLKQARYGEMREGTAALIFVTEPFVANKQVKADQSSPDNIPVLKLNSTKNYLTGIYPYSIMSSSFYPVHDNGHALKVAFSSQEWCGQVYAQLNNREQFEVLSHSYFESEGDQHLKIEKTFLENELWNKIRIAPETLPVGSIEIIPSLEYIRLSHKELKKYTASTSLTSENGQSTYEITYPELNRSLKIHFTTNFPHTIESWSESFTSGYGANAKTLTSTGTKINRIKSPYWQKNSNRFLPLRDTLGL